MPLSHTVCVHGHESVPQLGYACEFYWVYIKHVDVHVGVDAKKQVFYEHDLNVS